MNKQNVILGLVVVVTSVVLSLFFGGTNTVTEVREKVREGLGAQPGPDFNVPYLSINGVKRFYGRMAFAQATNTPCVFVSPSATSTLKSFVADFREGTSTDLEVRVHRTANETFATSSGVQVGTNWIWADNDDTTDLIPVLVASTSAGNFPTTFQPNTNVVMTWGFLGRTNWEGSTHVDSLTGYCNAVWEVADAN